MKLSRREAQTVRQVISVWESTGFLTAEQAAQLNTSIVVQPFDWQSLAKYSFWVAIACAVTAIGTVIISYTSPIVHLCELSVLATSFFFWGRHQQQHNPQKFYSIESTYLLGVICTALALERLGTAFGCNLKRFSPLVLFSCLIYLSMAVFVQSSLIWVCGILALGGWFGAETGYMSGWGVYYLGMSYPLRFVPFGCVLIAMSYGCRFAPSIQGFERPTLACGLLYLFIALWILSIFGNKDRTSRQELFRWSSLFAAAAAGAVYHGVKMDDGMTRGYGVTFFGINLYTRYFEYFWGATHKAIFFTLLAVSFWVLGSKAQTIWEFGSTPFGTTHTSRHF